MFKGLLGKKIGMTQIFDENGIAIPITVIEAGPCYVTPDSHARTRWVFRRTARFQ